MNKERRRLKAGEILSKKMKQEDQEKELASSVITLSENHYAQQTARIDVFIISLD